MAPDKRAGYSLKASQGLPSYCFGDGAADVWW